MNETKASVHAEALDGKFTFREFVAKHLAVLVVILHEQDLPPV
jgi:hypothetical protein